MPTTLKATLLFMLAIVFFSCKKSANSNSDYYFKGSYDGIEKTFNTTILANKSSLNSSTYYLTIVGASRVEESDIVLWSDQDNFTAGTTYSISTPNTLENNILSYCSALGSSAPDSNWNTIYSFGNVSQNFTCTITEITSVYVKGIFSGVLYMNTDSAVVSKTVKDGQFFAKF